MHKILAVAPLLAATGVAAFVAVGRGAADATPPAIHVVEHASSDQITTDADPAGDSVGDILTFANDVFDAADAHKIGTDQGFCIRTVAGVAFECWWTTFLPSGQLTVEGPFYDAGPSTLAITGGTGAYRDARGTMTLSAHGTTGFDFVFAVKPRH
jgi:allene oxide cyclase